MILIVDDDQDLVRSLSRVIKKAGFSVETAANGVEAYEKLKLPDCKCMLLDVNMPKINGVELLMLMQAEGVTVPTIVMAGFDDYDDEEMKSFESVVHYMQKPFESGEMMNAIDQYALS